MLPNRIDILSMHHLNMSDERTRFQRNVRTVTVSPAADRVRRGYDSEWWLPYLAAVTSFD